MFGWGKKAPEERRFEVVQPLTAAELEVERNIARLNEVHARVTGERPFRFDMNMGDYMAAVTGLQARIFEAQLGRVA